MGRGLGAALAAAALVASVAQPASASTGGYALPFKAGQAYVITQSPGNTFSHDDKYNRTAVDFGLPYGTPVVASQSGVVYFENWNGPSGIEARINHGGDSCTQYAHLSRTIVNKGQKVLRGQLIGYSGASGYGSLRYHAPHLHWAGVYCPSGLSRFIVKTAERGTTYPTGVTATSKNGGSDLKNPGSGRCSDVAGGSLADGAKVQLYTCNRLARQIWLNEPQSYGRIRVLNGKKCLDVQGGLIRSGTKVQSYRCNKTSAQKWSVRTDGTIRPSANTALCLDVRGGGKVNGTQIQIYKCTSSNPAQKWY